MVKTIEDRKISIWICLHNGISVFEMFFLTSELPECISLQSFRQLRKWLVFQTVRKLPLQIPVGQIFSRFDEVWLYRLIFAPHDVFKRFSIDGYITPEQAGKLKVIKAHYENLESRKAELEELILALAAPYQQELAILQTAPGISSDFTAIGIISEIGTNMEAFPSAKHLSSWAGLTPTNNESVGKKKSVRVSKAGCYIKPLLVQCANAVVKSKKYPEIRNRYLRIKKRRGHKKAIIAIARMLLTALYHMLKNGENYNAELYKKSELPPADREITVEQAIIIARNQGYKIKSATA